MRKIRIQCRNVNSPKNVSIAIVKRANRPRKPFARRVPDRRPPQAHVRRCVTARCRRAEVRDASVGLNVSKALDVGGWRPCGVVQGGGCRGEMIVYPSRPILPPYHRPPTPPPWRTPHSTPTVPPHRIPPRSPLAPIDPATTYSTSGQEWNKVPPGGMVRPRDAKER